MLMLDSGQAQARQMIEVSRTYLVYLNYFYPDWGHSAIYSRHYSLVVFCSKVSPKSQRWPCSIPACKMTGLNIDREHTYKCIIYTLSHMKNMLKTPFSPCWRPFLCSKSGHCSLYIMFQPYSFEAMKQNLRYWVSCTHACASQYSSTLDLPLQLMRVGSLCCMHIWLEQDGTHCSMWAIQETLCISIRVVNVQPAGYP